MCKFSWNDFKPKCAKEVTVEMTEIEIVGIYDYFPSAGV